MTLIVPFRALRPTPASAANVAAVPYDVVSVQEAHALAAGNPLSFLHVSRAEIDLPAQTDAYSDAVYRQAVANFEALKREAPMVVEDSPSLYVYRLKMGNHVQTGVAGTFSIDEYERGVIKKHEHKRPDKEDDRKRHMNELRAPTGPVVLPYRRSHLRDTIVNDVMRGPMLFDFTAPDDVQHTIWRADEGELRDLVASFDAIPSLYIADGHHRAASAARARQQLRATAGPHCESDRVLAVAFPDRQMQVLPYNRV